MPAFRSDFDLPGSCAFTVGLYRRSGFTVCTFTHYRFAFYVPVVRTLIYTVPFVSRFAFLPFAFPF